MSVYSTSLKAEVYEPRQFNQQRCEFRLDKGNTLYYSNLRLVGLNAQGATANDEYNFMAGSYSLIRSIRLMDGGVELDRCDEANRYLAWKNMLNNNEDNRYIHQRLAKHRIGYRLNSSTNVEHNRAISKRLPTTFAVDATNTPAIVDGHGGWLDLRQCLPILNSLVAVDTNMMKNLRLLIEWEQDATKIASNSTNAGALTILQPILVADEVRDPSAAASIRSQMKSFSWKTYEHDQVNIPAGTRSADQNDNVGVKQSVSRTINGFDNKYVSRMVMMKTFSDKTKNIGSGTATVASNANVAVGGGDFRSQCQHREVVQLQVNGSNLFAGAGLDSPALKADLHDECWGSLNIVPNGIYQSVGLDAPIGTTAAGVANRIVPGLNTVGQNQTQQAVSSAPLVGQADYIGVRMESRINDLQLKYERSCLADASTNQLESEELEVHIFAEVPKSLTMEGGGNYTIAYL